MTTEFAGRTALVTGAGRGIGRAVALELAAAGASLILIARSAGQLASTRVMALAQGALPGQVHVVPADLGDPEQRAAAVTAAAAVHVDILVNNAGPPSKPTPSTSPPSWRAPGSRSTPTGPAESTPPCRPGSAGRAGRIGTALHERFTRSFADGALTTPGQSAVALIGHLSGDDTGAIWDVSTVPAART